MRAAFTSSRKARTNFALGHARIPVLVLLFALSHWGFSEQSLPLPSRPVEHENLASDSQDAIKINVDLVVLHVTVQNSNGEPVTGLGREAFQVYENGVPQRIESFRVEEAPVTVGLVIDNSGSMRPKRAEVITAALGFARSSNVKDQFFVVNFNEQVSFGLPAEMPFTDNAGQLERALSKVVADGMTALYDAVAAALAHLKNGYRDKEALLVISDGSDNASHHDLSEVVEMARRSEAIIYTIGLYDRDDPDRNPGSLRQLAKATGGDAFFPQSIENVLPICERVAREIRSQYTITYLPSNLTYDGKYRRIEVKGTGTQRLRIRTRAGYYAPK